MKKQLQAGSLVPSDVVLRAGRGEGDGRLTPPAPARPAAPPPTGRWVISIRVVDPPEGNDQDPCPLLAALIARIIGSTGLPGASPGDRGTGGGSTASGSPDAEGSSSASSEASEGGASD